MGVSGLHFMGHFMSSFKTVHAAASQQDWSKSQLEGMLQITQLPRQTEWFNMSLNNLWSGVVRQPCKWKATASLVAAIQRPHRLNDLVLFAQNIQNSFSIFTLGVVCILLEKALLDTANRKSPYSFLTRMLQQRQFSGTGWDLPAPLQVTLQKSNEPKSMKWE